MSRLLLIEDRPALLSSYAEILEAADHEIVIARDGGSGLRLCHESRPDLVLLGSVLPDIPGLEVCRRIKGSPELAGTFVIMLSSRHSSAEEQAEGLEMGADGYLATPVEPRMLVAQAKALLRIKKNEQELRTSEERQRQLVTELTEANRRLEEYNRLKAEFVANMSHELRTPLTAIIGFVQLVQLSEGRDIPATYARTFERILRNGKHLLALIDDVLDVAKIEAGRMRIHREYFDLGEVVQSAFNELQSLARQKGLDYRLCIAGDLSLAFTDPLRVRQVVINLLSNAIKFTHSGSVELELAPAVAGF
jgi:signal transduction histidine kinase